MKRGTVGALAIFLAVACHAGQKQAPNIDALTRGLWVHLDSAWEHYGEENSSTQVAYARVARFAPDGEFSWIACMLLRNDKKHWTTISAGDGQVIFMGRWRVTGDQTKVDYVKTYEMVRAIDGSNAPFAKVDHSIVSLSGDELIFDGKRYLRTPVPTLKEYEEEYIEPERKQNAEKLRHFFRP